MKRLQKTFKMLGSTCNLAANGRLLLSFLLVILFCNCAGESLNASEVGVQPFQEVKSVLAGFKQEHGYAPNDVDFFGIVLSNEYSFTSEEQWALYEYVLSQQSPRVQKNELIALMKSKRDSIRSFRTSYDYIQEVSFGGVKNTSKFLVEYAIRPNMYYLDPQPAPLRSYVTNLFDGNSHFARLNHIDADPVVERHEIIDQTLSIFYRPESPLGAAMLLPHIGSTIISAFHIVDFLEQDDVYVFEKTEFIDGMECIVVGSWASTVYLALDMDYSVARHVAYYHHWSDSQVQSLNGRSIASIRDHSKHQDCGNAIWLPLAISSIVYDQEGVSLIETSVTVNSIKLNEEIEDDFFASFMKDDLLVVDVPNNLSYRWSERPSINDTLKSVVKSKRTWFPHYLSLTVGCLLILLVVVVKYIKYLKRKQTA